MLNQSVGMPGSGMEGLMVINIQHKHTILSVFCLNQNQWTIYIYSPLVHYIYIYIYSPLVLVETEN